MNRKYALAALAVFGASWAGWISPAAAQEVKQEAKKVLTVSSGKEKATGADQETTGDAGAPLDVTPDRRDAAVSLKWVGPSLVRLGKPTDYSVVVRNTCGSPLQQVYFRVRIPAGIAVTATEPSAQIESSLLLWDLGTLLPNQERTLQMRVLPDARGQLACHAWVTFTAGAGMTVRVCEPKLQLKAAAPEKVMVGDTATVTLTATNTGDGPAEQVKVHARLSEGLDHPRGRQLAFDIGTLAPGESRSVQVHCAAKTNGEQRCEGLAVAEGDLKSQDAVSVSAVRSQLALEASGPKLRYLDRKAVFVFKVTNTGDAPASNVTISSVVPAGFKLVAASDGGQHDAATRSVSWFVGEVGPGQAKEVRLEGLAVAPGEHRHQVSVQADRGFRADGEVVTRVEGLSNLVVRVKDSDDPIEVGAETTYTITVSNMGSRAETDLRLTCAIPDKVLVKSAQGPTPFRQEGKDIVFDPLPQLEPRGEVTYQVVVKTQAAGDARFKVQIAGTSLTEPVVEVESTRIYQD